MPHIECRHLDSRPVYELCTHPVLLDWARKLYGEDLLLWRSTFIEKAAGGPEFRWHQDWGGVFAPGEGYGLEPPPGHSPDLVRTGTDIVTVAELLGHASLDSTRI